MYILAKPNQPVVYPYSFWQLRQDNPKVRFPRAPNDEMFATFYMLPVERTNIPDFDSATQKLVERPPELVNGKWVQTWALEDLTPTEKFHKNEQQRLATNKESLSYLSSTDWYVIRKSETGVDIPADISAARQLARAAIK